MMSALQKTKDEGVNIFLRQALLGLQCALLFPLLSVLPSWLLVLCAGWFFARLIMNFQGQQTLSNWTLFFLLCVVVAGLVFEFVSQSFSLSVNISFLVGLYLLKGLELRDHRDVLWLLYLSLMLIACIFFINQSLLMSLYLGVCLVLVLSLIILSYRRKVSRQVLSKDIKYSFWMLIQALPLMLFLLLFIPRLSPLWSVPMMQNSSKTGMSNSMSPGSISQLLRSDELVFRASFTKAVPAVQDLYWRGSVFNYFDGRAWSVSEEERRLAGQDLDSTAVNLFAFDFEKVTQPQTNEVDYQIILEPSHDRWLYGLVAPVLVNENARKGLRDFELSKNLTLFSPQLLNQRVRYSVKTLSRSMFDSRLSEDQRKIETALPQGSNPVAAEQAQKWLQQAKGDPAQYVATVLRWFSQEDFYYTLEPPLLSQDAFVDEFLFSTRRGFCEHYAGSFAFLLRAAGIPARVVVGYLGGEVAVSEKLVTVRQLDAHAWVEWWSSDKGWQRVDPTSAVSPARILEGAQSALGGEAGFLADSVSGFSRGFSGLQSMRLRWDAINNSWNRWALGFDEKQRQSLLQSVVGELSIENIAKGFVKGLLLIVAILLAASGLLAYFRPVEQSFWVGRYKLIKQRLPLDVDMNSAQLTPKEWANAAKIQYPQIKYALEDYIVSFNELEYALNRVTDAEHRALIGKFRKQAWRLEWQVLWFQIKKAVNLK